MTEGEINDCKIVSELLAALRWTDQYLRLMSEGKPVRNLDECLEYNNQILEKLKDR